MLKRKILKILITVACILTLIMPHASVVLAEVKTLKNDVVNDANPIKLTASEFHEGGEESSESLSEEGYDKYDTHSYKYIFGDETPILKIVREDDKNEKNDFVFSDAFYCLNGEKSFPKIDGAIEYARTVEDLFEDNISTLDLSDEKYNSLCWLLDNIYLRKQMTLEQRTAQKDAIIESAFSDELGLSSKVTVDDIKAVITDDDFDVIQQWAIWYFGNPNQKTMQDVLIEEDNLPTIDLIDMIGKKDSMPNEPGNLRYEWCTKLYQYFVTTAKNNETVDFNKSTSHPSITGTNTKIVEDGENYKAGPFKINIPEGCTDNYQLKVTDQSNTNYEIEDVSVNEDFYIYISKTSNVNKIKVTLTYYETKASVWTANNENYQPIILVTREGKDSSAEATLNIQPDLALRKYIIAVNDKEIKDREPNLDISKLKDGTSKTAEYKHRKDAVEVKVGDTVTYRMAVYNEGNVVAKFTGIVDYLPIGLELIKDNEINQRNGWQASEDGRIVTTNIVWTGEMETGIPAFEDELKGIYLDIVCKITDNVAPGSILTNIAEIKSDNIEDRDSTPDSLKDRMDSIDLATYTGNNNKVDLTDSNYYYKGYEDDDDFEKVVVEGKAFDLSLQKFITKVNGKEIEESREPEVNTTPLKNGLTNAIYTQVKTPVVVEVGDIVTYTIRVYNEGEEDGYAETVADYLPDGLGYLVNYKDNIENCWAIPKDLTESPVKLNQNQLKNLKIEDFEGEKSLNDVSVIKGSVKLTSTLLSSNLSKSNNLIKAFDGSDKLSYKDIQVTCVVLSNSNLENIAEITDDADTNGNEVDDRDSKPDTVDPKNYPGEDVNQDDHDYEILTMKKFDLSLQKFITEINDKKVTDREPKVSYSDGKISYEHPDTHVEVNNGDAVTYTIRVYNEGEVDGYAAEIGDDIPNGLVFDGENEINKKYGWKMLDSAGNETTDSSKAVEIRTDYLSKEKAEERKESALLTAFDSEKGSLFYLDVKAVFKVNTTSSNSVITNTAEITKDTDPEGNEIDDIDSIPNNKKLEEDDIDQERVHVGYFDLALQKDLTKAVVTEGDSTKEYVATNGELLKVEINKKKINSTIVKFVYHITIKNEGTIAGFATEIRDYIPEGLQFVETDNQNWKEDASGTIVTNALAKTLLQPGESASVEVVLRWVNGENNLGLKTNVAEISEDYNDANDVDDIDSTPDNKIEGEDDIDDAPVILSITTGRMPIYIILTTTILTMIGTGIIAIKKYIL